MGNLYNYTSTMNPERVILHPQPPNMQYCMATAASNSNSNSNSNNNSSTSNNNYNTDNNDNNISRNAIHSCTNVPALSNDFGTISMSTNYEYGVPGYPDGVTWNSTAKLFINIGYDNAIQLDAIFVCRFVPSTKRVWATLFSSFCLLGNSLTLVETIATVRVLVCCTKTGIRTSH